MTSSSDDALPEKCAKPEFADLGMCECGCCSWVRYPMMEGFEKWHCTNCHTAHPLLREDCAI